MVFQYEKADYGKVRDILDQVWQELFRDACVENDVEKQWEIFSSRYYEAEKLCVPVKRVKTGKRRFAVPLDKKTLAKPGKT